MLDEQRRRRVGAWRRSEWRGGQRRPLSTVGLGITHGVAAPQEKLPAKLQKDGISLPRVTVTT